MAIPDQRKKWQAIFFLNIIRGHKIPLFPKPNVVKMMPFTSKINPFPPNLNELF